MSQTLELTHCAGDCGCSDAALAFVDPFTALRFHFGMLLGVADFEAEQAYHRGKMRLHNAWLHRDGTVWGLGVSADVPSGEIRVERGLAVDAAGRELYLPATACLNVGAWYEKHKDDPELIAATAPDGTFDAHVVARYRACLTREVPALSEPCEGSGTDTAFSRVSETVELLLLPGRAPARTAVYRRLRVLFGLAAPEAGDTELVAERDRIAGLPADQQAAARAAALGRFAVADSLELVPGDDEDGEPTLLFPAGDATTVLLAETLTVTLAAQPDGSRKLTAATVDNTVRRVLLPTATLQELAGGAVVAAGGPHLAFTVVDDANAQLASDRALLAGTVTADSLQVASIDPAAAGAAWTVHTVTSTVSADGLTVDLALAPDLPAPGLVRLVARGGGPTPILDTDGNPPAGNDGHDFVAQVRRS